MLRISTTIILFLLAFLVPWWLIIILGTIAVFVFEGYYEFFAIGILIDSLYNAPAAGVFHLHFVMAALALLILALAEFLKRRLTFYAS